MQSATLLVQLDLQQRPPLHVHTDLLIYWAGTHTSTLKAAMSGGRWSSRCQLEETCRHWQFMDVHMHTLTVTLCSSG